MLEDVRVGVETNRQFLEICHPVQQEYVTTGSEFGWCLAWSGDYLGPWALPWPPLSNG